MLAIRYDRRPLGYFFARFLGKRFPQLCIGYLVPARLVRMPEPKLPSPHWVKVKTLLAGICGSDISVLTSQSSLYFSALTSYPFVLGHEGVGEVVEVGSMVRKVRVGDRVVLEPALSCPVRELKPCSYCEVGLYGNCERVTEGIISKGVQTGYCRDTGGTWGEFFVAHEHQLHLIPRDIPDEAAVLAEPFACALHAVIRSRPQRNYKVLIIGCGTMGLMTIKALRLMGFDGHITAVAKYAHQGDMAWQLGADAVVKPDSRLDEELSATAGARVLKGELGRKVAIGGYDLVFDCVASSKTISDALRWARVRGKVMLVGMPATPKGVDWAPVWHKELQVIGTYAYGVESLKGLKIHTIEMSIRALKENWRELCRLLTHTFPLTNYRKAIAVSAHPGKYGAVKVAFDMRLQ